MNIITGSLFRDAVISAANEISHCKKQVDELNVFPVPDGDTGTNMSMTISAAGKDLARNASDHLGVGEVSKMTAGALLRGARGNSGVILSLLFRGLSKGLAGKETADGKDLANALDLGVKAAYKAVMKPTEGTILTVAREAAEKGLEFSAAESDPVLVWQAICEEAEASLNRTPELLPVLKKAGVVDAGGKGFCVIAQAMLQVFLGNGVAVYEDTQTASSAGQAAQNISAAGQAEVDIHFAYCTEFIVNRENKKDPLALRAYLESIGDCVVVVDDEEIIKVHVHTNDPGNAIQEGLKFGSLMNMKIENMRLQHQEAAGQSAAELAAAEMQKASAGPAYAAVDENNPIGFVAVAAGSGVQSLFSDLGASQIVSGGQTMNPSTDDILQAIHAVPAKCVFVLPNNKNIIMAAEQAIRLADRKVVVLHTKTIPQGISAMLAFDPDQDVEANQIAMNEAFERVQSGSVTFAARDADFDGFTIKEGELMAMLNGKLSFTDQNLVHAAAKLAKQMVKKEHSFFTLILGEDVSDETGAEIESAIAEKLDGFEITTIRGDQPVYYLLMSAE